MFDAPSILALPAAALVVAAPEVCACTCRSHQAVVREAVAEASNL
jgi:hypothetical protein